MEIILVNPSLIDSQFFAPSKSAVLDIIECAESTGMIYPPIFIARDEETADGYVLVSVIGINQLKAAQLLNKRTGNFEIAAIVVDSSDFDLQAIVLMTSLSIAGVESQR